MAETRFTFFRDSVLPRLQQSTQSRTMVFVPSYFDYVRVRNLYRKKCKDFELTFCVLSEYSSNREVTQSRSGFFHGEVNFMLMTERFHFFRRYRIRGVHNIVFYGLPMVGGMLLWSDRKE
jgi:U3 small nucleolar RNA-associated protein 25